MNTAINQLLAAEHTADLRRTADRERASAGASPEGHAATIQLRLCAPNEMDLARRLAELDDAPELEGPVLLAFSDGQAVAGLSLRDQRVVANPFVPTRDAVALLRLRAEHVSGGRGRRRLRNKLHLRFA
jgi:hypothetical protein